MQASVPLISQASPDLPGALDPGVIQGNGFMATADLVERYGNQVSAAQGDHDAKMSLVDQPDAGGAHEGGQQPVGGRRRAAAHQVPEDGNAGNQAGVQLKAVCQVQGVADQLILNLFQYACDAFSFGPAADFFIDLH